jgi:flagellar biosynthetic protein FliQ
MNQDFVIGVFVNALMSGGAVMAPLLATGLIVGISVGALMAATQVNEPTLTFVPKVLGVGLVGWIVLPWGLDRYVAIFRHVIESIAEVAVG